MNNNYNVIMLIKITFDATCYLFLFLSKNNLFHDILSKLFKYKYFYLFSI